MKSASRKWRYFPFANLAPQFFFDDLPPACNNTVAYIVLAISAVESVLNLSTTMISIGLCICDTIDFKQSTIVPSECLEGIIIDTRDALLVSGRL